MQDWVHELVVRLSCHGRRFELIADCWLDAALDEQPSSRFHLGETTRSIIGSHLGYVAGSELALLARLGAETNIGVEQRRIVGEQLAYVTEKLGRPLDDIALYTTKQKVSLTLAATARAAGQTELAHELITDGLLPHVDRLDRTRPLTASVRQGAAEIRFCDLAARGDYIGLNLSHEWSFKILASDRELEIHPNASSEGRAGVLFSGLDLTEAVWLRGTARLASAYSRPVRFRIDLMAVDGTSNYAVEHVVRASQPYQFDELLPGDIRKTCDVSLSTEMASPSDQTEGAWARWTDIRIARR
jgi:hypothetical protein